MAVKIVAVAGSHRRNGNTELALGIMAAKLAELGIETEILPLAGKKIGCWRRKEITELAIVLGAGVDWWTEGRIRLNVQIAKPGAFAAGAEGGGKAKDPARWVISAEGKSIEDAERYVAMRVTRDIYRGH